VKVIILQVGKAKESALQVLCDELQKRLSAFVVLEIKTVREVAPSKLFLWKDVKKKDNILAGLEKMLCGVWMRKEKK
jgi:23S rRNA pseudoU1915 N3-methylase RlmH